jgi:hypothetical protein
MKIAVFYHSVIMGNWQEVDQHIKCHLHASGLLDRADVYFVNTQKDLTKYEFPTLCAMRGFAMQNPEYYILYLHSKGVSRKEKSIADWREYMLYWLVDNWRECVKKLEEGNDTVGVNYMQTPMPHYQGNFWWAKASHVKDLCLPRETKLVIDEGHRKLGMGERHKAEMWLLSKEGKHHSLHSYNLNPYLTNNPRENYTNEPSCVES